ncbi:MAG: hypothetical protein M3Y56_01495, partial [Armatimonadota bacterium]|nr:hypothetical protein [Armatimonadota bacterium]
MDTTMYSQEALTTVMDRVPVDDSVAVNAAIEAIKASLRESKIGPPISSIAWELITDSNGRGAVSIMIVLEDDPSGELYGWEQLQPIFDLIWNEFTERELSRWPYMR